MAFTLEGRYDLPVGNSPWRPTMPEDGVMIYRKTLTEVRKAVWNVSDALLATLGGVTSGDVITVGGMSASQGKYAILSGFNNGAVTNRVHTVHIDTGAEDFINSPGTIAPEKIASSSTRHLIPGTAGAAVGIVGCDFDIPITGQNRFTAGAVNSESPAIAGTIEGIPDGAGNTLNILLTGLTSVVGSVIYFDIYRYLENSSGVFSATRIQGAAFQRLNHGNTGASFSFTGNSSAKPNRILRDGQGKLYALSQLSTNETYWHTWDEADLISGSMSTNQTDLLLSSLTYAGVGTTVTHGAFHINQYFQKAYFALPTASNDVRRLCHKKLPMTSGFDTYDVDTNGSLITGIWTFPPYVYVAKSAGTTYGPQLIKFYDSELDATFNQRFPSGGGKDEEAYIMSILR